MIQNRPEDIRRIVYSASYDLCAAPEISVLIPTFNRATRLSKTLKKLEQQECPAERYEIVVVDDGSTDATEEVLASFGGRTPARFACALVARNGGPARARNIGLGMCRGRVILNMGDDIEPTDTFVGQHDDWHRQHPDSRDALLGITVIPKVLKDNGFMRWIETGGTNFFFPYHRLEANQPVDPIYFYTCNLSFKKALVDRYGGFDESFPFASHEDLELGYRLASHGMRLIYDPGIRGLHWHKLTIQAIARRIYYMGYSANLFWKKIGEEGSLPRKMARRVLALACSTPFIRYVWQRLRQREYQRARAYPLEWQFLLYTSFFMGLSDAYRKAGVRI